MSWITDYFAEADKRRAEELERAEREAIASGKERFDLAKLEQLLNRGPQAKREAGHRSTYYLYKAEFRTLADYAAYLLDNEPWDGWWPADFDVAQGRREKDEAELQLALEHESYPSTPEATLELLARDDDESVRRHATARLNAPAVLRARFHLPYNRRYGFGGEFPLKLLFIDDFTGRPDPRPLEDRIEVSVTTATFEKRMSEFRPADAATRVRWDELGSVIAAVEAAHPAALMELWNASLVDLRDDFEDASELSRSGLSRLIDAGIYNWPCCAARPPYSALVFGYPLQAEVTLARSVFNAAERVCTPLVGVDDVVTMARDIERTGWTLNPYGSDKRADLFAAWSLIRYVFMLHCHYRAKREGLEERMQMWLDMHATHRRAADPTRPLVDGTARLEAGDIIHLEATPQPPPGVAERKVAARAKLPYVE